MGREKYTRKTNDGRERNKTVYVRSFDETLVMV